MTSLDLFNELLGTLSKDDFTQYENRAPAPNISDGIRQGCGTGKFEDGSGSDILFEYGSGSGSGSYTCIYIYIFVNVYICI
jgi:hypothetical protein